jgi:hypothetical protein
MLATNAGLLTPVLGDPSPWNPQRLYINGEAGAWYDPGDLTAEKVAWRRNLLTWSEDFTNAAWTLANPGTRTANTDVAPDGTTTADTITDNIVGNYSSVRQAVAIATGGAQYRGSVYAKKTSGATSFPGMTLAATGGSAKFASVALNTDTGVATARTGEVPDGIAVQDFGTYWRVAWTITTLAANTSLQLEVAAAVNTDASATWSAATQGSAVIWGAMLAPASVDPTYQRITDFTSDFLAAFPTHALYQDSAGTTPVTALGQPVGLALDKSRGALANLGAQLLSTGTTALLGTATAATYNTTTGAGTMVRVDASNQSFIQFTGLNNGSLYRFEVANTGAVGLTLRSGNTVGVPVMNIDAGRTNIALAQPASGTLSLVTGTGTGAFTVVSVREVPGVHKIQPTSASREALDARVNLLTYSEQFDNAAWQKQVSGVASAPVVTANAGTAPDGTTTADRIVFALNGGTTSSDFSQLEQTFTVAASSYASALWLRTEDNSTKVFTMITAGGFVSVTVTGTWQRFTATGTTATMRLRLRGGEGTADSATLLVWGGDFRLATDAAYPYQRVTTATDYADVGVPRSFLHDGFDDSSYTASNLDLSGTDKVTVWAGVYKNSDATGTILMELTSSIGTNNGSFALLAPTSAAANNITFASKGTLLVTASGSATAPVSRVVSGLGDISGDSAVVRLNGVQAAINTGDQGTGNYSNAVLFIGRRNNATEPFNGKIYTIIIRGGVTDAATLALTERYVGSRMGIVL